MMPYIWIIQIRFPSFLVNILLFLIFLLLYLQIIIFYGKVEKYVLDRIFASAKSVRFLTPVSRLRISMSFSLFSAFDIQIYYIVESHKWETVKKKNIHI